MGRAKPTGIFEKYDFPLNEKESSRLYWELSRRGASCEGVKYPWKYKRLTPEEFFTLVFLQTRYDPRLVAIMIHFFCHHELHLDPLLFHDILKKNGVLTVAAVIGEFVLQQKEVTLFRFLTHYAQPVSTQLFYKNYPTIGGTKVQEIMQKPLWYFKKWGFLATELPLLQEKNLKTRHYLYDFHSRVSLLREMVGQQPHFRLSDYLRWIHNSISRQQALKDLTSLPWIRKKGKGKGTTYQARG